jgi:D-alanyl-D-alanine carboxypeptidase
VAAGVADIDTGAPLTAEARFRAGSIAKPFVADDVLPAGYPSGLFDEVIGRIAAEPAKVWIAVEFIAMATAKPPVFAPGEGWGYSNTDYSLLGLVIVRATGRPWREAVRTRVIEPARGREHHAARARRSLDGGRLHARLRHDWRHGH